MRYFLIIFLSLLSIPALSQTYTDWESHEIIRFYKKIELDLNSLDKEGEEIDCVYITTKVDDGTYEVEVYKISSKLYQIKGTNIYMYFRYSPYMYSYDQGILKISNNAGMFYKKE